MTRGIHVLLWLAFFGLHAADNKAALPTYHDLAPSDGWRYFYSDGTAAESDMIIDTALRDAGFYDNWALPEFDEPDVLSISWQGGSVPIGFGYPPDDLELATLLPTPVSGRNRTLFLRQTFDVPADIIGPTAIDLTAIGATVYIDGAEILRENCCITSDSEPTVGSPGFLDESSHVRTITGLYVIDSLSPGPHTIAASAHPSGPSYDSQILDLRLFSPISEKPWKGSEDDNNWSSEGNWYFGVPGPTDFAVFRRESRANARLDTPITLSGIQFDTASYTGHTVMGNGEIRLKGDGGNGGFNATGGHHTLAVDIRLDSDVDAQIQSSTIDIEGPLNLNGHTLSQTGDGLLAVMSRNESGSGTIRVESGTLSGKGTIAGDVITSNGWINAGDETERSWRNRVGTLTVTGNVTGRVELDLYTVDGFDVLSGGGNGVADVGHLKVDADRLETYDGATFQLFTDWPSLSIGEVELPDIGSAEWDTSRLQEGILSVSLTDPDLCDFDASGFCTVADLDLLTIDVVEGNNDLRFDMNGDDLVNRQDVDVWLLDAALLNGFDSAYLPGDANLDGSINASDLMTLGLHWQSSVRGWSQADFILDGVADARDLNELAKNWQKTLPGGPAAVPEPMSFLLMFLGVGFLFQFTRRLRGHVLATLAIAMTFLVSKI